MARIIVDLPPNRDLHGTIRLEASDGRVLAGPFPALGRAREADAVRHGNLTREPTRRFGDTPTGEFVVSGVVPTGPGTRYAASSYGGVGAIRMVPVGGQALLARMNGRDGLLIHGGTPTAQGALRRTHGCIRVADQHLRHLIDGLAAASALDGGKPALCRVGSGDPSIAGLPMAMASSDDPDDGEASDPPPGFRFIETDS